MQRVGVETADGSDKMWKCPINVVLKVLLTKKQYWQDGDTIQKKNVSKVVDLYETQSEYDVVFDSGVKTHMLLSSDNCCLTFTATIASLKHVSNQVRRAKWPHGTYGSIMFFVR